MRSVSLELVYGLFRIVIRIPETFLAKTDFDPDKYVFGISAHLTEDGLLLQRRRKTVLVQENQEPYTVYIYAKDTVDPEHGIVEEDYSPLTCKMGTLYKALRKSEPNRVFFPMRVVSKKLNR